MRKKEIIALIRPFKLDEVRQALTEIGVSGLTVTEVKGFGRQKAFRNLSSAEYVIDFVPKMKIEVVIKDEIYDNALEIITNVARTGKIGDEIFVRDIGEVIRIRTGESGVDAL